MKPSRASPAASDMVLGRVNELVKDTEQSIQWELGYVIVKDCFVSIYIFLESLTAGSLIDGTRFANLSHKAQK